MSVKIAHAPAPAVSLWDLTARSHSIALPHATSCAPNEPVEKALLTGENGVFGGQLTLPKHEIADCGAFHEVTFFRISPKNLLGDFFYSLDIAADREPVLSAIRWSGSLGVLYWADGICRGPIMSHLRPVIAERTERGREDISSHREALGQDRSA